MKRRARCILNRTIVPIECRILLRQVVPRLCRNGRRQHPISAIRIIAVNVRHPLIHPMSFAVIARKITQKNADHFTATAAHQPFN